MLLASSMVITLVLWYAINHHLPDAYNPFEELSLDDEVTFVTRHKIKQLKADEAACFAVLKNSKLKFERLPDQERGESCGLYDAALLHQSNISYGGGVTLTCPALVGLAMWEKKALMPLADEFFDQPIVRIKHYGTYACRNVNNRPSGRRSQHAYANAIDIAGFVLADGTEISVLKDWGTDDKAGEFLAAIHQSACQYFTAVLGPEYNSAHHNHFHFDQGPWSVCT